MATSNYHHFHEETPNQAFNESSYWVCHGQTKHLSGFSQKLWPAEMCLLFVGKRNQSILETLPLSETSATSRGVPVSSFVSFIRKAFGHSSEKKK